MIACTTCGRHRFLEATECPFCHAAPASADWTKTVMSGLAVLVLAACYGTGTKDIGHTGYPPPPIPTGETGLVETAHTGASTADTGASTADTGASTADTGASTADTGGDTGATTADTGSP